MRLRGDDRHVDVIVDERSVACEIDDAIVVGARLKLARVSRRGSCDEDTLARADHRFAAGAILRIQQRLQALQTLVRNIVRHVIAKRRCRRISCRC